jgi:hypothetical protein
MGWPQTKILLISASQVTSITGVSHCTWPYICFFFFNELLFCDLLYLLNKLIMFIISKELFSATHIYYSSLFLFLSFFFFWDKNLCVAQVSLELLSSSDSPASAPLVHGTIGMPTALAYHILLYLVSTICVMQCLTYLIYFCIGINIYLVKLISRNWQTIIRKG